MDPITDARLVYVHALSSLHAGTGQGIGVIDLPIAREKATGIPFLPGSSLKGSLRDLCPELDTSDKQIKEKIFGPSPDKQPEAHSGAAQFSDQRLLLLPVRSLVGTFAWVTSPYILKRFVREAKLAGFNSFPEIPKLETETSCLITETSKLGTKVKQEDKVLLEDLDLAYDKTKAKEATKTTEWAKNLAQQIFETEIDWQELFKERFCIVHDDVLSFLLDTATEVSARIVLNNDKTTNNLWYEETLPAETVLYGLIFAKPPLLFTKKDSPENEKLTPYKIFNILKGLTQKVVQLGGKATVGHGLCSIKMVDLCKEITKGASPNANT